MKSLYGFMVAWVIGFLGALITGYDALFLIPLFAFMFMVSRLLGWPLWKVPFIWWPTYPMLLILLWMWVTGKL